MLKCTLRPDKANYTAESGEDVIVTKLDGGASRQRADVIGATSIVTAQWTCSPKKYDYIKAIERACGHPPAGPQPFLIDLILDSSEAQEYQANLIPKTFKLTGHSGSTYVVQAQLEVTPLPYDEQADQEILGEDYASDYSA